MLSVESRARVDNKRIVIFFMGLLPFDRLARRKRLQKPAPAANNGLVYVNLNRTKSIKLASNFAQIRSIINGDRYSHL